MAQQLLQNRNLHPIEFTEKCLSDGRRYISPFATSSCFEILADQKACGHEQTTKGCSRHFPMEQARHLL